MQHWESVGYISQCAQSAGPNHMVTSVEGTQSLLDPRNLMGRDL